MGNGYIGSVKQIDQNTLFPITYCGFIPMLKTAAAAASWKHIASRFMSARRCRNDLDNLGF